ncbi:MAG TPA: right-handed parallel beta-helix repeat-containing protein [Chitinophagaceae bacterium]
MKKNFKLCFITLLLFIITGSINAQTTYYVSTGGSDANDGSSWANAFRNLTTALAAGRASASASVIINMAEGTYKPTDGTGNGTDRDATFKLYRAEWPASNAGKALRVYGGFNAATGVRDITANPTILSGDLGTAGDIGDNSYHIGLINNWESDADSMIVDGFIIYNGIANGSGGFLYHGNLSEVRYRGGGLVIDGNFTGDKIKISNCVFTSNSAIDAGAALYTDATRGVLITNCVFSGNSTGVLAGGIYSDNTGLTLTNCIFSDNVSPWGASALHAEESTLSVTNCTFSANNGQRCIEGVSSNGVFANNIIWGNNDNGFSPLDPGTGNVVIQYNDIEGNDTYPGTGNVNVDPSFKNSSNHIGADNKWGTADDGLQLNVCSPVKNIGSNDADKVLTTTDFLGAKRILFDVVDMGAYESTEEAGQATYYRDADVDGYGDPQNSIQSSECSVPDGYVRDNTDCDDSRTAVNPAGNEICGNNIDDNCNGQIDEGCSGGECANATHLNTNNITEHSARLNWAASINPAKWEIQYKKASRNAKWVTIKLAGSARSVNISSLAANQKYSWHIKARCGKHWTTFSPLTNFKTHANQFAGNTTTQQSAQLKNVTEEKSPIIKLYPNPTRGQFVIELHLADHINTNGKIQLVNMMGQTVSAENANISNGILQKNVSISSSLTQGIYIVKVVVNDKTYVSKLMYEK